MIRQMVKIDEEKCNGCGLCAQACHEGAIAIVNGKAKLIRDDYCDGLGHCLPSCPTGAITLEEREAVPYDEAAVLAAKAQKHQGGCPGSMARVLEKKEPTVPAPTSGESQLRHWPVQIKLAPINAPWLDGARLLIAADCTAFAYGRFHEDFLKGHVVLIGCPKLDEGDYTEKLTAILSQNEIQSLKILRMEVPCCGGIERAAVQALKNSGKFIPWQVVTLSVDGKILSTGC